MLIRQGLVEVVVMYPDPRMHMGNFEPPCPTRTITGVLLRARPPILDAFRVPSPELRRVIRFLSLEEGRTNTWRDLCPDCLQTTPRMLAREMVFTKTDRKISPGNHPLVAVRPGRAAGHSARPALEARTVARPRQVEPLESQRQ